MAQLNRLRVAFHYPGKIKITTKALSRLFGACNVDPEPFTVVETATKYYVGTPIDMALSTHPFDFLPGEWIVYDYYDRYWGIFAMHNSYIGNSKTLIHEKTTAASANYGYISIEQLQTLLTQTNVVESHSYKEVVTGDAKNGIITFGGYVTDYRLYTTYMNEYLGAFLLVNESFINEFIPNVLNDR